MIEKQIIKKVKCFIDNGMEFYSTKFDQFWKNEEIVRHRTIWYTPQQNGVAERMKRTLLERVRCMLSNAGLSKCFWAVIVRTTCYLVNQSLFNYWFKNPEKVWSATPANYSYLWVFSYPAYFHINDGKLESWANKAIFLGYAIEVKGYWL